MTTWLAVLTLLVAVQTVAVAILAIRATKLFTRAETTLDAVDKALEPIAREGKDLIADLHALRETAQRAERRVSNALDTVGRTTGFVKLAASRRLWPLLGAVAAGKAIAKSVSARRQASRKVDTDAQAVSRFVDEGGPIHDTR